MANEPSERGWYLLRASSVGDKLTVTLESAKGKRERVFNANLLPGRRLRTYLWLDDCKVQLDPESTLTSVDKVSWLSVHSRAVYRIFKYTDFGLVKKIHWSLASLLTKGIRLERLLDIAKTRKHLFANLDNLEGIEAVDAPEVVTLDTRLSHSELLAALSNLAKGTWIVFTFAPLKVHPKAKVLLARKHAQHPLVEFAFSHHFNSTGRCFIKPTYQLASYLIFDFIQPALFIQASTAKKLVEQHTVLSARAIKSYLIDNNIQPLRIDEILVESDYSEQLAIQNETSDSIEASLADTYGGAITAHPEPLISIIIPTYNGYELLKSCVDGLINKTTYPSIEIIVVDNNSDEEVTLKYLLELEASGITVLRYPHPFNYSAINNYAVKHASGELLCFLNNDIEVISTDWLESMSQWALRENVGAVGAQLLYPNGTIQHAGLIVGMGGAAGHLHRFSENKIASGFVGSMLSPSITSEVTAVTAACLLVKRSLFDAVSGFDEDNLAIAYNDVDFCLELYKRGYKNIYCSKATLYHHESVSRGDDLAEDKIQRYMKELKHFQLKWQTKRFNDPLFSQHLHLHLESQPVLNTNRRF